MSFIYDSALCAEAHNLLINPNKRLSAELDWFLDLSKEKTNSIRKNVDDQEPIATEDLTALSKLNATIYNLALSDETDHFEIAYTLKDIDEQFSDLDIRDITKQVNECHVAAKMAAVQEQDVSLALGNKREDIRQTISEKLSELDDVTYIELITILAENCFVSEDHNDGVILSDIVDQYEIRMQSEIEESTEQIKSHIERLKSLSNDDGFENNLKVLIRRVQKWDKLVQPLQLKSMVSGMPHLISEDLGRDLRNLALYLHNKKGKTEESLALIEAMQDTFAEIENLSELFEADSDTLNDLVQVDKYVKEVFAELDSLQNLSGRIKAYPSDVNIENYIDKVKSLDTKIRSLEIDYELKVKLRVNLCYLARNVAVSLHNNKNQTAYALTIAIALASEFSDILELRGKLSDDVASLNLQRFYQSSNRVQQQQGQNSKDYGCAFFIGIVVIFIIVIVIVLSLSSDSSSSTKSSSSFTQTPSNNPGNIVYSGSNSISRKLQLENEIDELDIELSSMEISLNSMKSEISFMESQLEELSDNINYYENRYYTTGLRTYYDSYSDAVDEYNSIYYDYSKVIDDYNNLIDDYSLALEDYNTKVDEYNGLN